MPVMNDISEILHKIEAKLYPNYLGKGEGAYIAWSLSANKTEERLTGR